MRVKLIALLLTFSLTGLTPLPAAEAAPDPLVLLERAWQTPSIPYRGRVTIREWQESDKKEREANVYFRPPADYRVEMLTPEGSVDRVVFFDKGTSGKETNPLGLTSNSPARRFLDSRQEKALLLVNYRVSLVGSDRLMSRPVWILELTPTLQGKPVERLWVDRETHLVLEARHEQPSVKGGYGFSFTRFEPNAAISPALFPVSSPESDLEVAVPATQVDLASQFGSRAGRYASLPGGYTLQSLALFEVQGQSIRHLRYTDGLQPLSLFETKAPIQVREGVQLPRDVRVTATGLGLGGTDAIHHWKKGRRYFTLVGDLPDDLAAQIRTQLP